jgi:hypothetical protein
MSNAVRLLEQAGRECWSPQAYEAAVARLEVDAVQKQALVARDEGALVTLLKGPTSMFFGIFAPEEQPDEEAPAREIPEEPEDLPRRED